MTGISPDPTRIGLGIPQNRDRRVIAMRPLGGQDMGFDEHVERHLPNGAASNLIGDGRKAERALDPKLSGNRLLCEIAAMGFRSSYTTVTDFLSPVPPTASGSNRAVGQS